MPIISCLSTLDYNDGTMPYYLDRWDYICPNGHRNTIDKSYLATEPCDSAVAFSISFPDKLPCAGCQYKLILPTADSVLHCNISEFALFARDETDLRRNVGSATRHMNGVSDRDRNASTPPAH